MDELAILHYLDRLPTSIDILHLPLTVALILMTHVTQKPKKVSETAIPSEIAAKP
jgi:hypothetical protein